jgi:hypothetical protein
MSVSGQKLHKTNPLLTARRDRRHDCVRSMLLHHAFSNRRWQRDLALFAMTRVIVKGARESVRDR